MKKILLIEDDPNVSAALEARLAHAGYDVLTAEHPVHATFLSMICAPDLIISDVLMPMMEGPDYIRQLTSQGDLRAPFIFLTASRRAGLRDEAMAIGAADFFEKPYDPVRLLAAVKTALESSTSSSDLSS